MAKEVQFFSLSVSGLINLFQKGEKGKEKVKIIENLEDGGGNVKGKRRSGAKKVGGLVRQA